MVQTNNIRDRIDSIIVFKQFPVFRVYHESRYSYLIIDSKKLIQVKMDKYYIYHESYELTYLNQRIRRMSWFK
jgi:hypothetical protein